MKWSEVEDYTLRVYYPSKPTEWPGWPEVLPGKTATARRHRARRLGIFVPDRNRVTVEQSVVTLMGCGCSPSEIDMRMGYPRGTAHDVVLDIWASGRVFGYA